jgi:hypothetical protein
MNGRRKALLKFVSGGSHMDVTGLDVWVAEVEDRPGALGERLNALAAAGVNLECIISQRGPDPGGPVRVFLTPVKGAKQMKAAREAGFEKAVNIGTLRVVASNKAGLLAGMAQTLGAEGINLRGVTATATGRQAIIYLGLNAGDDKKAARVLKRIK